MELADYYKMHFDYAIEDSPNGIRSAKAAGCYTVMIPDLTQPTEEDLQYCDRVLKDLSEILTLTE